MGEDIYIYICIFFWGGEGGGGGVWWGVLISRGGYEIKTAWSSF